MEVNHDSETELWVGYYKKASGKQSIDWPQSVDVGLCFGWIDGIRKSVNEESYKIRFTPRKPKSHWSNVNIKRIEKLKELGLVTKAGLETYAKRTEENSGRASFEQSEISLGKEFEREFKANNKAWSFWQKQPPGVVRQCTWWVISAKREETRRSRLEKLIMHSERQERIPQIRRPGK